MKYVNALELEITNLNKLQKTLNIDSIVTKSLQLMHVCILCTMWHSNEQALCMYIYINIPIISFIKKL